ncbi:MAG: hypothetical protein JWN31_937 [Frankiales bacterium]|nr:hypothetical protein [Frankiales bacterium]
MSGVRATPMFCPYCGEESIRPWGDDPDSDHALPFQGSEWKCEDCLRVFEVRFKGSTGTG